MQSVATRNERFDGDHPERRYRDEDGSQAAGYPLLGEHQAARAGTDDDDAERAVYQSSRPLGMCAFEKQATRRRMPPEMV